DGVAVGVGDVEQAAAPAGEQAAGVEANRDRLDLLPAALDGGKDGEAAVVGDPGARIHADGSLGRQRLRAVRGGRVAAPVAYVAAVRPRAADHVRGDADGNHLLRRAAGVNELNVIAARGGDPEFAVGSGSDAGRVGGSLDLGRPQFDGVGPGVAAVRLADGGADVLVRIADADALPLDEETDD